MTLLARGEAEAFLSSPDPRTPVILICGADAGLVSERAARIAASMRGDGRDEPEIVKLDGEEIAADPLRLLDEANAISLFGGRRIIRIKLGAKNIASAVESLLRAPPSEATILIEAGDLRKTAPVRAACERAKGAVVIVCYADEPGDIRRMIGEAARNAGLTLTGDAVEAFLSLVGSDRLSTRAEIDKLLAYAQGRDAITADDVEAVVADAGVTVLGDAIDGAFSGDMRAMAPALAKLAAAGERPDGVLMGGLNHAWLLANGIAQIESGQSARTILDRSGVFFRRRPAVERQLQLWRREGLSPTIRQIGDAILAARANAQSAASQLDRTFLRIALTARKLAN
ncbi:MAG: DNA polymerase III subunit delta [Rhizobiales bacterium 65-9]|mgnify:CR=1 FL=1|nr:DNA polymerase III subunit delta [Hyphomicrobiales bacterium]OJY34592.1 MAG: DNA polymerase III subunit delta [Rhizobiales bacterium 65-9]